jgi:hypothetical protein
VLSKSSKPATVRITGIKGRLSDTMVERIVTSITLD